MNQGRMQSDVCWFALNIWSEMGAYLKISKEKKMNKKVTIGILLLTATALIGVPGALAYSSYVGPLQSLYGSSLSCGTCHVNPGGGGTLTAYGTSFSKQANHAPDPTAALTAIGAPPGATSPPVLTKITVSPATASVVVGGTQAFTAATLDQNGKPITATVTWTSSNTAVGTIDSAGKFTAKAAGIATITAASGSVSGTATATVTASTPPSPGKTVKVTFVVIDSESHKPVREAVVSMDGVKKVTGKTGKVTFTKVINGNHKYIVTGEDYAPASGQISVAGNTIVSVKLVPVHEDEEHEDEENDEHDED